MRKKCKFVGEKNDGLFWMSYEDFLFHFEEVDVCYREGGFNDLALDVREERKHCGLCTGLYLVSCSRSFAHRSMFLNAFVCFV